MAATMATSSLQSGVSRIARVPAPSSSFKPVRAPRRLAFVCKASDEKKNIGDKAKEVLGGLKDAVSNAADSAAKATETGPLKKGAIQGPNVPNVSGTPKGMGADAKDSNTAGRTKEGWKAVKGDGPGHHTMVTKREAYLEGTKREEQKEKYLDKQDEMERGRH